MLRQSKLYGQFSNFPEDKKVVSTEYDFGFYEKDQKGDVSRHREGVNSFNRFASSNSDTSNYNLYSFAQLGDLLEDKYGVHRQQLVNICVENDIIRCAGAKTYITKYSQEEIFQKLEDSNKGLKHIAKAQQLQLANEKSQFELQQELTTKAFESDRFAAKSKRTGMLTSDDLRKVPSYQFCLHPQLKSVLNNLEQDIVLANREGIVSEQLKQQWDDKIREIKSEKDLNSVLKEVKAYLGR